jgi:uncharacterized phage-associated protein
MAEKSLKGAHKVAASIHAADFFIALFKDIGKSLEGSKTHMLLCLAQGWSLVKYDRPLFTGDIAAENQGPVVTDIEAEIPATRERISGTDRDYDPDVFTPEEIGLMLDVAWEYGGCSAEELSDTIRRLGTPWWDARRESGAANVIPQESLKDYFGMLEPLTDYTKEAVAGIPAITERNSKGIILLPADWDDDEWR